MAFFRIFQRHRTKHTSASVSSGTLPKSEKLENHSVLSDADAEFCFPGFEFPSECLRLVIFREGDRKDRRLLFDSECMRWRSCTVAESGPDTQEAPGRCTMSPSTSSGAARSFTSGDGTLEIFRAKSDTRMLEEMIFGAVSMSYKGDTLKLHYLNVTILADHRGDDETGDCCAEFGDRDPSQLMFSKVFPHIQKNGLQQPLGLSMETVSDAEVFGRPLRNNESDSDLDSEHSTIHSMTEYFNVSVRTIPMDIPERIVKRPLSPGCCVSTSNDGGDHQHCIPSSIPTGGGGCVLSSSQSSCTSTQLAFRSLPATPSTNQMTRRRLVFGRQMSLDNGIRRRSKEALEEQPGYSYRKRTQFGVAVLITFREYDGHHETNERLRRFFFSHIQLIEKELNNLQNEVLSAASLRGNFITAVFSAWSKFVSCLSDLYTTPRLRHPLWISLLGCNNASNPATHSLRAKFLSALYNIVVQFDTKSTNFFISTLLTAVLSHHLSWTSSFVPDVNANFSQRKAPKERTIIEQGKKETSWHPYNVFWMQYLDVLGGVTVPPSLTRVVVSGQNRDLILKLIFVLSYFIRCNEAYELTFENVVHKEFDSNRHSYRQPRAAREVGSETTVAKHQGKVKTTTSTGETRPMPNLVAIHNNNIKKKESSKSTAMATSTNCSSFETVNQKRPLQDLVNEEQPLQEDISANQEQAVVSNNNAIKGCCSKVKEVRAEELAEKLLALQKMVGKKSARSGDDCVDGETHLQPNKRLVRFYSAPARELDKAAKSNIIKQPSADSCLLHGRRRSTSFAVTRASQKKRFSIIPSTTALRGTRNRRWNSQNNCCPPDNLETTTSCKSSSSLNNAQCFRKGPLRERNWSCPMFRCNVPLNATSQQQQTTLQVTLPRVCSFQGLRSSENCVCNCEFTATYTVQLQSLSGHGLSVAKNAALTTTNESHHQRITFTAATIPHAASEPRLLMFNDNSSNMNGILSPEEIIDNTLANNAINNNVVQLDSACFTSSTTRKLSECATGDNLSCLNHNNNNTVRSYVTISAFSPRSVVDCCSEPEQEEYCELNLNDDLCSAKHSQHCHHCHDDNNKCSADSGIEENDGSCQCGDAKRCCGKNCVVETKASPLSASETALYREVFGSATEEPLPQLLQQSACCSSRSSVFSGADDNDNNLQHNCYGVEPFRNLGHSLFGGLCDSLRPHFAVMGVVSTSSSSDLIGQITQDLHQLKSNTSNGDIGVAQTTCVLADTGNWQVRVLSSQSSRSSDTFVGPSHCIVSMLENTKLFHHLNMSPDFCMKHIENCLADLFAKSVVLSKYVEQEPEAIDTKAITDFIGCEVSDLSLLWSIASVHSPEVMSTLNI